MNRKAIEQARIQLTRAAESITALAASNRPAEIETHWSSFLSSAGRVFTKLEQGAKAAATTKSWFGTKVHQRRTDPLLCYLWHARNADEHAVLEITQPQPGTVREIAPTAEDLEGLKRSREAAGKNEPMTVLAMLEITPPHIRLLPVVNRGQTYYPPPGLVPFDAGQQALATLDAILNEAVGV
jgi:hypothetical protein